MKKTTLSFFAVFIISIMNIYSGNYTPKAGDYVFTGATNNTWTTYTNWSVSDGAGGYTGTLSSLGIANTSTGFCYIPVGMSVTTTGASKGLWIDGTLTTGTSTSSVDGDLTVAGTLNLNNTLVNCTNCTVTPTGTIAYLEPSETTTSPCKIVLGYVAANYQKGNDLSYSIPTATLQNNGILKNVMIEIFSNCQKLTIQGNPVETPILSGIRMGSTSANVPFEIVVDQDIKIQKYSTKALSGANYYGGLITLATNSPYDFSASDPTKVSGDKVFTLKNGRKITFMDEYSGLGYRRDASPLRIYTTSANPPIANLEKWTYNINGTIDAKLGFVNLCSTIGDIDLSNKFTLNNNGTIICGKWVREHSGQASGNYVVVNNLGTIKYSEAESYYTSNTCAIGGARIGSYTYGISSSEVTNSLISPYIATAVNKTQPATYNFSSGNKLVTISGLNNNDVVSVYSITGALFARKTADNTQLEFSLNSGLYIVSIKSQNETMSQKVVVK